MSRFIPTPKKIVAFVRELGALGPLAVLTVVGPVLGVIVLGVTGRTWFPRLEEAGPLATIVLFGIGTVLMTGSCLAPTHAASLVAGMLFGAVFGPLAALAFIAVAALLGFGLFSRFVAESALERLARRPKAYAVHQALLHHSARRTILLIALLRLSPVMPFAVMNLLMASSRIGIVPFLGGTVLGIAPRVIAVSVAGAGLATLDLGVEGDRRLLVLGALATLVTLLVAGNIARPVLRRVAREGMGDADERPQDRA